MATRTSFYGDNPVYAEIIAAAESAIAALASQVAAQAAATASAASAAASAASAAAAAQSAIDAEGAAVGIGSVSEDTSPELGGNLDGGGFTISNVALSAPAGLVKGDVGLGNVDNTADTAKPVSTAQQTALDLKANLASPALSGTPTAPTPAANNSSTQIATTAYVQTELTDLAAGVSASFDTLAEIATDLALKNVKSANLSDVANAATAFGNIKQAATTSATGVTELAVAAEYRANTAGNLSLTPAEVWTAAAAVTLTDAATIAVDMSTFINAVVTLTTNRALGNPSNAKVGQTGCIRIVSGGFALSYGADWEFADGTAPVLGTGDNLLFYTVLATGRIFGSLAKSVA